MEAHESELNAVCNDIEGYAETFCSAGGLDPQAICSCVQNFLGQLHELKSPGILGLVAFFVGLVSVNSLCLTMNCCSTPGYATTPTEGWSEGLLQHQ